MHQAAALFPLRKALVARFLTKTLNTSLCCDWAGLASSIPPEVQSFFFFFSIILRPLIQLTISQPGLSSRRFFQDPFSLFPLLYALGICGFCRSGHAFFDRPRAIFHPREFSPQALRGSPYPFFYSFSSTKGGLALDSLVIVLPMLTESPFWCCTRLHR